MTNAVGRHRGVAARTNRHCSCDSARGDVLVGLWLKNLKRQPCRTFLPLDLVSESPPASRLPGQPKRALQRNLCTAVGGLTANGPRPDVCDGVALIGICWIDVSQVRAQGVA